MASVPVPVGATELTVTGSFVTPYQLALSTSWVTSTSVGAKSATGFIVQFSTPAPAPAPTLDYFVLGPQGAQPSGAGVLFAASVPVAQNATGITITGVFTLPYQVTTQPSWITDVSVTEKTATQFRLDFATPAPFNAMLDYVVFVPSTGPNPTPGEPGTLAGELIMNIRDQIPDPTYDAAGLPLPDADGGIFRASTLYGWLDDAVRILARAAGAVVSDWTAVQQTAYQPWYILNPRFNTVDDGFSNQWRIDTISINEGDIIWPSVSLAVSQSLYGYIRRRTDHLEFGLWPIPALTDPTTTLAVALPTSPVTEIVVASTTNFLSFGYVQIDNEIIQYQRLSSSAPNTLLTISRGVCGTSATTHAVGAAVRHLGLWLKGTRSPLKIINSTSVVELPLDIVTEAKLYVMAMCRRSENEHDEARALMNDFRQVCDRIRADPYRKENEGQIVAYGDPRIGPLIWNGQVIRP